MGGIIKAVFGSKPRAPQVTNVNAAPPPPTTDEATAAETESNRFRRRKGRAANILTSGTGTATAQTATKQLLGQ